MHTVYSKQIEFEAMGKDKNVLECIYVENKEKGRREREQKKPFWNPEIHEVTSDRGVCDSAWEEIFREEEKSRRDQWHGNHERK